MTEELLDVYDINRCFLGYVKIRKEKRADNEYFRSVHVWVKDAEGNFLIQQRPLNTNVYPGYWSITGGAIDAGESSWDACFRETCEEVGLTLKQENSQLIAELSEPDDWNFLVDVWLGVLDGIKPEFVLQKAEFLDAKWVSAKEVEALINNRKLAPNVILGWNVIKSAGLV